MTDFEKYFSGFLDTVHSEDVEDIIPLLSVYHQIPKNEDVYSLCFSWMEKHCTPYMTCDSFSIYVEKDGARYFVFDSDDENVLLKEVLLLDEKVCIAGTDASDFEDYYSTCDYCGEVDDSNKIVDGEEVVTISWFVLA